MTCREMQRHAIVRSRDYIFGVVLAGFVNTFGFVNGGIMLLLLVSLLKTDCTFPTVFFHSTSRHILQSHNVGQGSCADGTFWMKS